MKLHYFKSKGKFPYDKNFGDDLNPWLWKKLLPKIFDENENSIFVGIGTLLNEQVPKANKTVVFSSGVGYGQKVPTIDSSWTIYCLRGPLSARALGVPTTLAITDGALLVRRLYQSKQPKSYRISYMPHYQQAIVGSLSWQKICKELGFGYIDPCWEVEKVLDAISQTEVLITEAMHGAIVADALRVPWIPLKTSSSILSFKWQDWCSSVGIDYQSHEIGNLSLPWYQSFISNKNQQPLEKMKMDGIPIQDLSSKENLQQQFRQWLKRKRVTHQLANIAKTAVPLLSDDKVVESLTIQLEEKLQKFKDDAEAGYFDEK